MNKLLRAGLWCVGIIGTLFLFFSVLVLAPAYSNFLRIEREAESGSPRSQMILAHGYETGNQEIRSLGRVRRDEAKAFYWYTRSAEGGDDLSAFYLARMYESRKEYRQAMRWYTASATKGYPYACLRLVDVYKRGELGERQDAKKAAYWAGQVRGVTP